MKHYLFLLIVFIALSSSYGATPTDNLHAKLKELFKEILTHGESSKIKGKEYTFNLTLKHVSKKHIIFTDAYIQSSQKNQKYQIAKWLFTPEVTQGLESHIGETCEVHFKIDSIRTTAPYKNIPHLVVTIKSIKPLKALKNM